MTPMRIGIIGGTGQMGRWFQRFFVDLGHSVLIAGRKTTLTYHELARQSDLVILSAPLNAAISIAKSIGPEMTEKQALMDVCSQKEEIVHCMERCTAAQVLGTHPLFGPSMDSIVGQNVVFCPARGETWAHRLQSVFQENGAVVTRMSPEDHDKQMAVVQGLTHLLTVAMGRTLEKMTLSPESARNVSTPIFRVNLDFIGRLLGQDLGLYADLIGKNRYLGEALGIFMESMAEGRDILTRADGGKPLPDKETSVAYLGGIRDFFGRFCDEGMEESDGILNRLFVDSRDSWKPESR